MFGGKKDPEETYGTLTQHIRNSDVAALESVLRSLRQPAAALAWQANGKPPLLHVAAERNDAVSIGTLLAARADVNAADPLGTTALYLAARSDGAGALETLLAAGADVNCQRGSGATALYVAAQNDSRNCLSALLLAGASVDRPKEGGFTPLLVAAMRNHSAAAAMLLDAGAVADRAYDVADRWTALMLAAHLDHADVLHALCDARASLGLTDAAGRTAQQLARDAGHEAAAALLAGKEEAMADVADAATREGLMDELRRLSPERAALQLAPAALEELRELCSDSSGGESSGVFPAAARLHGQCLLMANTLLPAARAVSDLARLDAATSRQEEAVAEAQTAYDDAVTALRDAPSDGSADARAAAQRDAAREAYVEALGALRAKYAVRQARGGSDAATRARVREAIPEGGTGEGGAGTGGGGVGLSEALGVAVPVLRRAVEEVGEAHAATVAAAEALQEAMGRERMLVEQMREPLADAERACGAAVEACVAEVLGGEPEKEMEQLALLGAAVASQVRGRRLTGTTSELDHNLGVQHIGFDNRPVNVNVFTGRRQRSVASRAGIALGL